MKRPAFQDLKFDQFVAPTLGLGLQNQTNATVTGASSSHERSCVATSDSAARSPPKQYVRVENRIRRREGEDTKVHKYRRIDHATFDSIQQEIHMYLDSVATRSENFNGGGVSAVDMAVYETFNILRSCWYSRGNLQDLFEPVRNISMLTLELLLTYGRHKLTDDGQYAVPRGGGDELPWMGCILSVLASYISCRANGAMTQRQMSLPANTHHRGAVYLPPRHAMRTTYNSCVSGVNACGSTLQHSSSPLENEEEWGGGVKAQREVKEGHANTSNLPLSSASNPQSSRLSSAGVSRLLLLNCHNFGWLDSPGSEDYESSSCFLRKVDSVLNKMMRPLPQTRPRQQFNDAYTNCLTSSALRSPCCTTVLLSDTILMDGGVPSLTVTRHCKVFSAHEQYGQGIACLVSAMRDQGDSPLSVNHATADAFPIVTPDPRGGYSICSPLTSPQVITSDAHPIDISLAQSNEEAVLHTMVDCAQDTPTHKRRLYYNTNPSPPQIAMVPPLRVESLPSASSTSLSTVSTSSSSAAGHMHNDYLNLRVNLPWSPVSCGHRNGPGIVAQAVLLAPVGPLIVHIQLEHAHYDVSKTQQALPLVQPLTGLSSGAANHNDYGSSPFIPTEATEEPELQDLAEWLLYLFQSPQPLLIVEWHIDRQRREIANKDVATPEPPSAVLQLLEAYANHMSSSALPFGHADLRDAVHATCRSIKPCGAATKFDGKDRPLIFVRELKAVVEMEHCIDEKALVTSLQYCLTCAPAAL
ncbi:unnamed protein product [Phytomonas sp. EM1]|nr:unnamed protein product [Phytomonas sp. EM1]|eukprot:CCW64483.1 unnamed protein product [Phytomonas sp. isolate EM1]